MCLLTVPTISSIAEKIQWLDAHMETFFRSVDAAVFEPSNEEETATTFLSSGVSQVNVKTIHNSIVVTEPMNQRAKASVT